MSGLVHLETRKGIAIVTIDNPPMNVLSSRVLKELEEVYTQISNDSSIVVVILTGTGRAFMAGADIKELPTWLGMKKEDLKALNRESHKVLNHIADLSKPTIAMLNGITFGGGLELALTCDVMIAEEQARIGLPEVKLGLFPEGGGTQRLPRLIGAAKAKELMFLGEPLTALEAFEIGIVNHVAEAGMGMEKALALAEKIANYSLQALSKIKKSVNKGMDKTIQQGLELELDLFAEVFATKDVEEGVQAFIEKRSPSFKHR